MKANEDTLFRKALNYDPVREEERRQAAAWHRSMNRGETPFFCRRSAEEQEAEDKRERLWFSYVENIQKTDDSPVHFICPKLESAVRGALRKGEGAITRREMASLPISLRELDEIYPPFLSDIWSISSYGITNLSGLEHATFVRILNMIVVLGHCNFPDLTPLAKLTKLEEVFFSSGSEPCPILDEQKAMLRKALPNCKIDF